MGTEQLAELIEKLPPESRALVERLVEALNERPAADRSNGGDAGILRWAGRFHLGGPVGDLSAAELHEND